MRVQSITNVRFTNQNAKGKNILRQQPQTTVPTTTQPPADTVSFKGKVVHGINTARKFVDYGDIFYPGAVFIKKEYPKAKKTLARLMNTDLSNINFSKSVFHAANFEGANLTRTNFENSSLDGSYFFDVITNNTNLKSTYLRGAIFKGDFGNDTMLDKANIMNVNFEDADMDNLILSGAIYDDYTKFPSSFNSEYQGLKKFQANMDLSYSKDFERMKLRYLNFEDANFQRAGLKRTDFKGCRFTNCNMRNTDMTRVYAKEAILDNCDLRSSELKQLNLNKAYLRNVDMGNCNLRGAVLTWRDAQNVNLAGSTYDQYTLFNSGFNPEAHGMIYKESSFAYYGIK